MQRVRRRTYGMRCAVCVFFRAVFYQPNKDMYSGYKVSSPFFVSDGNGCPLCNEGTRKRRGDSGLVQYGNDQLAASENFLIGDSREITGLHGNGEGGNTTDIHVYGGWGGAVWFMGDELGRCWCMGDKVGAILVHGGWSGGSSTYDNAHTHVPNHKPPVDQQLPLLQAFDGTHPSVIMPFFTAPSKPHSTSQALVWT